MQWWSAPACSAPGPRRGCRKRGQRVLLVDAWGPAHARASSGGESRMIRAGYGADEIYTRMAWDSLGDWRRLSERSGLPIFHQTGVLFFAPAIDAYFEGSIAAHRRLGFPIEVLDETELSRRFPMIDFTGITAGLYEPSFGALMARRAVQTLVREFVARGGEYRQVAVNPPGEQARLTQVTGFGGEPFRGDKLRLRLRPLARPTLSRTARPAHLPDAAGSVLLRPRGGRHALPARKPARLGRFQRRRYLLRLSGPRGARLQDRPRRPRPADRPRHRRSHAVRRRAGGRARLHGTPLPVRSPSRPLSEARVCQYENSSNGDFLIDRHPAWENVVLVGGGSGHGFKHGPAVGRYAADLLLGRMPRPEPRFSLATKEERAARAVH